MNTNTLPCIRGQGKMLKLSPRRGPGNFPFTFPLPSRCISLKSVPCKRQEPQAPHTSCTKLAVSEEEWRMALTLNRLPKDISAASNSASMQKLENKILAFSILRKHTEKPTPKASKAFFQSNPSQPQVGPTNSSEPGKRENALQKVYSQSFWCLNGTRDMCRYI